MPMHRHRAVKNGLVNTRNICAKYVSISIAALFFVIVSAVPALASESYDGFLLVSYLAGPIAGICFYCFILIILWGGDGTTYVESEKRRALFFVTVLLSSIKIPFFVWLTSFFDAKNTPLVSYTPLFYLLSFFILDWPVYSVLLKKDANPKKESLGIAILTGLMSIVIGPISMIIATKIISIFFTHLKDILLE